MKTHLVSSLLVTLTLGLGGCVGFEPTDADTDTIDAIDDVESAEALEPQAIAKSAVAGTELGCFNSEYFCELTVDTGVLSCPNLPDPNDVTIKSTVNGFVLEVKMTNWGQMQVQANAEASSLYTFHIGDSPTNDGWSGDAGTTKYDAEVFLHNNGLFAYRNDFGGSSHIASLADAIPDGVGSFCAVVADQEFVWYGTPAGASQSTTYLGISDPFLFRPNLDDEKLYVGINRTVGKASRTGSAIDGVVLVSLSPL